MTKTKSTKRALLMSGLALLMCVSMLIGSTFAWFTDSVTSGSNIIKSGTLDIVMEYWDGDSWEDTEGKVIPFVAADGKTEILWEPGCTYELAPFRIRNEGNLSAKLLVILNGVKGDEKLMEAIELKTRINNIPESVLNGSAGNQLQKFEDAEVGVLYGMPEGNVLFDWSLAGKGETTPGTGHTDTSPEFTVFGHMAEEAGNEYQDLSIEGVSITVIATQQSYETDSFNKYYDANSPYPEVAVINRTDDGKESVLSTNNVTVTLDESAPKGTYRLEVANQNVKTDNNGETTASYDIELYKDDQKVIDDGSTEYLVEIKVGSGLNLSKVLHKGEAVSDFEYDPLSEYVAFKTRSFSPFAVVYKKAIRVSTAKELQQAVAEIKAQQDGNDNAVNAYIVLDNDIVFDENAEFPFTDSNGAHLYLYHVNLTLDLNGHDIKNTTAAVMAGKSSATALILVRYSNLNIVGDGNIVTENKAIGVYAWAHSTVNIYGGNYITNSSERTESAVYVNNTSAKINVYGGTYTGSAFAFNTHNTSCTETVIVLNEGIKFYEFKNHFSSDYAANRIAIAEGCVLKTSEVGGQTLYEVVAE